MKKVEIDNKQFLQFDSFLQSDILHFTSTKPGWVGDGKCRFTGDQPEEYEAYRRELAEALDLTVEKLVFPRQSHSDQVRVISGPRSVQKLNDVDAVITNVPGLCVCVQTADCVPILLFDPVQKVIAAVHAGWRGTVSKLVEVTVERMENEFGCDPADLLAGIGPSVSQANYEVGLEVIAKFKLAFKQADEFFMPSVNAGKAMLDLWQANKRLLIESGVPEKQIEVGGLCTVEDQDLFFSARREGIQTGRLVSGIMLR